MTHIEIIWGNPNLTLGWCQLKQRNREKIALTTGPLKMSRGRFRAPRLIELDSGAISHTTSLRSVGAAPDSNSSALGGLFFFLYENLVLINGQGRGGCLVWSTPPPPKPMMVNNINMKGTMIQSWSSCHIHVCGHTHERRGMALICDTRAF
jgi:hypothetical protein